MAIKIVWTAKAEKDLFYIFSYWNNRNKSNVYSNKLNGLFNTNVEYLYEFPTLGRKTVVPNVRYLIVRDYLIFYKITDLTVIILRVWGGRQNLKKIPKILSE
jgi:toxin YoeB